MAGKLYTWGNSDHGQAGNGYIATKLSPTKTVSDGGWDDVQVSYDRNSNSAPFAVALKDGKLYSWGSGLFSQTGHGDTNNRNTPTQIGSDNNWESFAVGSNFCLAIKTNGTLWAWGDNNDARTGRGTTSGTTTTPTQVGSDTNWDKVAAGHDYGLAIKDDDTLWAWGNNAWGKTGLNTNSGTTTSPTQVGSDTNWDKVAAGGNHSAAIKTTGSLWGWGANASYQVGDGTTTQRTTPVQVGSDTNWASVSVGSAFTNDSEAYSMAIKTAGTLWTWGSNSGGKTGRNTASGTTNNPTQIGSDSDWEKVTAGNAGSTVAIKAGTLWAWGAAWNTTTFSSPSSGDGTGAQRLVPTQADSNSGWTAISSAYQVAAIRNGDIYFWGFNRVGVFGEGRFTFTTSPEQVGSADDWELIGQGAERHVLTIRDGKLFSTGSQRGGIAGNGTNDAIVRISTFTQSGSDTGWTQVASSGRAADDSASHSLGIRNGELYAWGFNGSYQLGDNTTTTRTTPTKIGSSSDWTMVAAGQTFSLGLRDGKIYSWGSNANGRTGQGTTSGTTNTPTQIGSDTNWAFITADTSSALAIKTDGTLWAWGDNTSSKLGDGTTTQRTAPVQIGNDSDWAKADLGLSHALAIKTNGTLYSWGSRSSGRLGDGNTTSTTTSPTQVGSDTNWAQISAGTAHSMALKTTGTIWAWGGNTSGQIGDGTTTQRTTPTQIGSSDKWLAVTTVDATSFAIETGASPPENTAAPSISGTAKVGQSLTASDGTWTGDPTPTFAYQWQVSDDGATGWSNISGATSSSYTITSASAGKYIRVQVTGSNTEGSVTADSSATAQITEDPAVDTPVVIGTTRVGETLTGFTTATAGFPTPSISYQWQRSADNGVTWANISGASSSTYSLVADDSGKAIRVEATATNSEGSASQASVATPAITEFPEIDTPTISGDPRVGETLTASADILAGYPQPTLSYQWQRSNDGLGSWHNISGATSSTHLVTTNEAGKFIRVQVTAINDEGTDTKASAATTVVYWNPAIDQLPAISYPNNLEVGETLTASTGTWDGYPAPNSFNYQWEISPNGSTEWTNISGAISSTLLLTSEMTEQYVRVLVSTTTAAGSASAYSVTTGYIAEDPASVVAPSVVGIEEVGETLAVSPGEWTGFPEPDFSYAWEVSPTGSTDWQAIDGADTDQLILLSDYAGLYIRALVTGTNEVGSTAAGSNVAGPILQEPFSIDPPEISGDALIGETLSSTPGTWGGYEAPSLSYQWEISEDGDLFLNIAGATSETLEIIEDYFDHYIRLEVTATNSIGTDTAVSDEVGPVDYPPQSPFFTTDPSIVGIAQVGEELLGDGGEVVAYPEASLTYQWQRHDGNTWIDISGAFFMSYTPTTQDIGKTIRLKVTAANIVGAMSEVSFATDPVIPAYAGPEQLTAPTLTGGNRIGQILTATNGTYFGYPEPTITGTWEISETVSGPWTAITGANALTLLLSASELGYYIRRMVVVENSIGSLIVNTAPIGPIMPELSRKASVLTVSNARIVQIDRGPVIGTAYDSEFGLEDEDLGTMLWDGNADAYIRTKKKTITSGGRVDRISETTVLIPALVEVNPGDILSLHWNNTTVQWKVLDVDDIRHDIGLPDALRCYIAKV